MSFSHTILLKFPVPNNFTLRLHRWTLLFINPDTDLCISPQCNRYRNIRNDSSNPNLDIRLTCWIVKNWTFTFLTYTKIFRTDSSHSFLLTSWPSVLFQSSMVLSGFFSTTQEVDYIRADSILIITNHVKLHYFFFSLLTILQRL